MGTALRCILERRQAACQSESFSVGLSPGAYGVDALWRRARRAGISLKLRVIQRVFTWLKAESVVVRLPDFQGCFEAGVGSAVLAMVASRFPFAQLVEYCAALIRDGDHVVDIGANIGLFSVLASRRVGKRGRVLAVEPHPSAHGFLELNLRRNGIDNVDLFKGVVSDRSGDHTFHAVQTSSEYSSLVEVRHPNAPNRGRKIMVKGETLDNLVVRYGLSPTFLKMDVEGAEGLILSGGKRTLSSLRPFVLSEVDDRLLRNFGWNSRDFVSTLTGYGYVLFDASRGLRFEGTPQPFIGDVIAVPKEYYIE